VRRDGPLGGHPITVLLVASDGLPGVANGWLRRPAIRLPETFRVQQPEHSSFGQGRIHFVGQAAIRVDLRGVLSQQRLQLQCPIDQLLPVQNSVASLGFCCRSHDAPRLAVD
jgi:hypothetical protein